MVLLVRIAAMLALHFFVSGPRVLFGLWRLLGIVPLAVGILLNIWADQLFKVADTTVKPYLPSKAFITDGPFALSRHPMYVGAVLMLAGLGVLLGTLTPFVVPPAVFVLLRVRFIGPEERNMERHFGEAYAEYRRRVRRRL